MIPGIMRDTHDTRDLRMIPMIYAGIKHDTLDLHVITQKIRRKYANVFIYAYNLCAYFLRK